LPKRGTVSIGRDVDCDVTVSDASVSRRHAVLHLGEELAIEDVGSVNGTQVDGVWIEPHTRVGVSLDDTIVLGELTVVVQIQSVNPRPRRFWIHDYFEARLEEQCLRADRFGEEFAVCRVSCPDAGNDSIIRETITTAVRAYDIVGTYGPGEFEVLVADGDRDRLETAVARISTCLAGAGINATVGVALFPADGRNPEALLAAAGRAARSREESTRLAESANLRPVAQSPRGELIVSDDSRMKQIHRIVERIAASTINVLILGETGVGKDVLSERIHNLSQRKDHPFLRLNCAALSESLLESELFGHERGAFTGAVQTKQGLLETAEGGTVFLDEVGELPPSIQVTLLRVIEERRVLRVGSLKSRLIDVRFVAATNRNLEADVERGTFRQDLFFRLNGFSLVIPPLRQRVSEIPGLAELFVRQFAGEQGRELTIAPEPLALLCRYPWPGNIRELRNVMERAVVLCSGDEITMEHLPVDKMHSTFAALGHRSTGQRRPVNRGTPSNKTISVRAVRDAGEPSERHEGALVAKEFPRATPRTISRSRRGSGPRVDKAESMRRELAELEKQRVIKALEECAGNQTRAAELLGMSRRTLINRLEHFGVPRPRRNKRSK
jgi:transcriptional regulator with PAS, ATPase and Fis domain